jgi:hypothetical protein
MEASQNPLWLQDQERRARLAADKAAVVTNTVNVSAANQSSHSDSHVMVWLGFFAVLAAPIWWLRRNLAPAKAVRPTRRTASRPRPSPIAGATRPSVPLREINPPVSMQAETSSPIRELTAHQQVEKYLQAFETDGAMPPMAYHAAIKALNLDLRVWHGWISFWLSFAIGLNRATTISLRTRNYSNSLFS